MPLPREHLLDELATAYVQAVAAAGGATIAVSRRDYGIDGTLNHIVQAKRRRGTGYKFVPEGFPVEFQLKGTTVAQIGASSVLYDLNVRNYELVVGRSPVATPLYLFLVCFSSEAENWIAVDRERLILRASAYWWTASNAPTDNMVTVRIEISMANRLTSAAIANILAASKDRFDHA